MRDNRRKTAAGAERKGSDPGVRGARILAATALIGVLSLGTAPAWAEDLPAATEAPEAAAGPGLAITAPLPGDFIGQDSVTISGTKDAGSTVAVDVIGGGCASPPSDTALTTWACTSPLASGENVTITATETRDDDSTRDATVTVKALRPPTIVASPPQQSPGVASGRGFPGATIHLVVGAATQACHAPVASDGNWLCTIANGPGTHSVAARQSVPWGTSGTSPAVTLVVNPAPPVEPPPTVTPPQPAPAPVQPKPAPASDPEPEPEPSPTPTTDERAVTPTLPWLDRPIFPGPGGQGPTVREALTNWGTPTGFGSALATPQQSIASGSWLWAPLLALAFIALIASPLRMAATALRGRWQRRGQWTGRNRGTLVEEDAKPRNPWLLGAVPLAATAGLIALAEGLNGEVRYMRLLFAVGLGLAILNVVGVAVATRFAGAAVGVGGRLRFRPMLLLAAAVATVIARITGMDPPLVGGVLIGVGFAVAVAVRPRAIVNLAQVGAVLTLGLVGWFTHAALGPVDGFWASVLSETLATLCLAGVGSALILMLPVGALPGRVMLEWSPVAWSASTLVVGWVTAAILLGSSQPALPLLIAVLITAGFAAVCIAIWAWANYVKVLRA